MSASESNKQELSGAPPVRYSGKWMSITDDRILEVLAADGPTPVSKITAHAGINVTTSQVSRRTSKLGEHRLIENLGNGVYRITTEGSAYLKGEYDAENAVEL